MSEKSLPVPPQVATIGDDGGRGHLPAAATFVLHHGWRCDSDDFAPPFFLPLAVHDQNLTPVVPDSPWFWAPHRPPPQILHSFRRAAEPGQNYAHTFFFFARDDDEFLTSLTATWSFLFGCLFDFDLAVASPPPSTRPVWGVLLCCSLYRGRGVFCWEE